MNKEVALTRRINKIHYPVVFNTRNGTLKPDMVWVGRRNGKGGVETKMEGGSYYLSWYEGRRRREKSVGVTPATALNQRHALQAKLESKDADKIAEFIEGSHAAKPVAKEAPDRETLTHAVNRYLDDIRAQIKRENKSPLTLGGYECSCRYFQECITRKYLQDVTADDMLAFADYLMDEKELSPNSMAGRFNEVMIFFKAVGHIVTIPTSKRPKVKEKEVEIYEDEEDMARFWAACTPVQGLKFRLLLQSGLRDQEFCHLTRDRLSRSSAMVRVKSQPQWKWKPKKGTERSVPIPPELIDEVLATMPQTTNGLIFPDADGNPDQHLLEELQEIAKRAGCTGRFYLHKFRSTYATSAIRRGVDLFTLKNWMGHKSIKTLERYVKALGGVNAKAKVEAIWADGMIGLPPASSPVRTTIN
jgi:integrase/recombinase XerD